MTKLGRGRWRHIALRGLVPLSYGVFFAGFFWQIHSGVGQYWDWSFPIFREHISNFFDRSALSWTPGHMGSPLGYASDYFVRFVISRVTFLQPEVLLYSLITLVFAVGAFGAYVVTKPRAHPVIAYLVGIAAMVNALLFYKYTAGHFDYLVSYDIFIFLLYYLLYRFQPTLHSAVVVGLFFALIGVQIQFFAFATITLILYFVACPSKWRIRHAPVMLGLPVALNLIWLSNFLVGAASLQTISGIATKGSFKGLNYTDFLNILNFSFAKATLLSRFFTPRELFVYTVVLGFVILLWTKRPKNDARDLFLLAFAVIMIFLCTGLFQTLTVGPQTVIYPMFREVGHFAPVMLLATILLFGRLLPPYKPKTVSILYLSSGAALLLAVISIAGLQFQQSPQKVNYASLRQQFSEFEKFSMENHDSEHRVLAYPFFDQYDLRSLGGVPEQGLPLKNTGHDSYSAFANEEFINNAVKPQDFKSSVQYRLLTTHNVDVLRPYNVRYIYDFSSIYESNYDRYVSAFAYDGNLSLIKNNSNFIQTLLDSNPGKVRRVSEHILEVTDMHYSPRVAAVGSLFALSSDQSADEVANFVQQNFASDGFNYTTDRSSKLLSRATRITQLFGETTSQYTVDPSSRTLRQKIEPHKRSALFTEDTPRDVFYTADPWTLTIYAGQSGKLLVNGQVALDSDSMTQEVLARISLTYGQDLYVRLNGIVTRVVPESSGFIGPIARGQYVEVFAPTSTNLIKNPSFENGLWQPRVSDCNAYDHSPAIGVRLSSQYASDGKNSLELTAVKHTACVSTSFSVKAGEQYLLSYDYKGAVGTSASYFMPFNHDNSLSVKGSQIISDNTWHTATAIVTAPEKAVNAQVFVHATPTETSADNFYDNFSLLPVQSIASLALPDRQYPYTQIALPAGDVSIDFEDTNYDFANLISNGSFEDGAWQPTVTDCNNYDLRPQISQGVSGIAMEGKKALQLSTSHHFACTYTAAHVSASGDYLLSFAYQGNPAKQFGYKIKLDDRNQTTWQEQVAIPDKKWHTYSRLLHIPQGATALKIYLYAYETNNNKMNTVRYDAVRLMAIPSIGGRSFVVEKSGQAMLRPRSVVLHTKNSTYRVVSVGGATTPFFVSLSESYHTGWQLRSGNLVIPRVNHFKIGGYGSGWYVDTGQICSSKLSKCHKDGDGSYKIELVAEFLPQHVFRWAQIISLLTLLMVLCYLAMSWMKRI